MGKVADPTDAAYRDTHLFSIPSERESSSIDKSRVQPPGAGFNRAQSLRLSCIVIIPGPMMEHGTPDDDFVVGGRARYVRSYALGRLRVQGYRQAWGLRSGPGEPPPAAAAAAVATAAAEVVSVASNAS